MLKAQAQGSGSRFKLKGLCQDINSRLKLKHQGKASSSRLIVKAHGQGYCLELDKVQGHSYSTMIKAQGFSSRLKLNPQARG